MHFVRNNIKETYAFYPVSFNWNLLQNCNRILQPVHISSHPMKLALFSHSSWFKDSSKFCVLMLYLIPCYMCITICVTTDKFIFFLFPSLLWCMGVHCGIYTGSYNVSNISNMNSPPPLFSFISPSWFLKEFHRYHFFIYLQVYNFLHHIHPTSPSH
jgi:hypothetical protein